MYEKLDFSSIIGEKFAVHCTTEEQANHFLAELERQFGKKFSGYTNNWNRYRELTCYSPYLDSTRALTYCNECHYRANGFMVVLYEILCAHDFGEFCSELTLGCLLG